MEDAVDIVLILSATLRLATPLILGVLAGLFSERFGIIDMARRFHPWRSALARSGTRNHSPQ